MKEKWNKLLAWIDSLEGSTDDALKKSAESQYSARTAAVILLIILIVAIILVAKACTT